jgi:hypothetical protein
VHRLALLGLAAALAGQPVGGEMLIDDFTGTDSRLGTQWRLVTDGVMGGRSSGQLWRGALEGRAALCLRGNVSLENQGGFVQIALELAPSGVFDAGAYRGLWLVVRGNGESYNLHLRTADLWLPWQSYRAELTAGPQWQEVRLPFDAFTPYRVETPLDTRRLRRLGLVAIGRAFAADLCIAGIGLYE